MGVLKHVLVSNTMIKINVNTYDGVIQEFLNYTFKAIVAVVRNIDIDETFLVLTRKYSTM